MEDKSDVKKRIGDSLEIVSKPGIEQSEKLKAQQLLIEASLDALYVGTQGNLWNPDTLSINAEIEPTEVLDEGTHISFIPIPSQTKERYQGLFTLTATANNPNIAAKCYVECTLDKDGHKITNGDYRTDYNILPDEMFTAIGALAISVTED